MKQKTVKTARKRVTNLTKNGKIMRRCPSTQHLTTGKSKRVLRDSTKKTGVSPAFSKRLKKMLAE